jgi:hypothetical protein
MKRLTGLYLEEIEIVLENLKPGSSVTVSKENSAAETYALDFASEEMKAKMEEILYFNSMDFESDDHFGSLGKLQYDDDSDY